MLHVAAVPLGQSSGFASSAPDLLRDELKTFFVFKKLFFFFGSWEPCGKEASSVFTLGALQRPAMGSHLPLPYSLS